MGAAKSSTNVSAPVNAYESQTAVPEGLGPNSFVNTILYTSPPPSSLPPIIVAITFKNDRDEIAFICSLCYNDQTETFVMRMNVNGQWQPEEELTGFNWSDDQPNIVVLINPAEHQNLRIDVYVNITQFHFSYSPPFETIRQIQYEGANFKPWVGKALPDYEVGKVVYIKGRSADEDDHNHFNINMVPSLPQSYVTKNFVLHMSFRFSDGVVVRNHKVNEQWGADEREGNLSDFLLPGDEFCIRIVAQRTGFEIGVNGSHFCYFEYRAPFTSLSSDMSVQVIRASSIEKIEYS